MRDPSAEDIYPDVVGDRDGWFCELCERHVDRDVKWPDPMSPSIDHIIPLSWNGPHRYWNVRIAHLGCNIRRGAGHREAC